MLDCCWHTKQPTPLHPPARQLFFTLTVVSFLQFCWTTLDNLCNGAIRPKPGKKEMNVNPNSCVVCFVVTGASSSVGAAALWGGDQSGFRVRLLHQRPGKPRCHCQRCLQTVTGNSSLWDCFCLLVVVFWVNLEWNKIWSTHAPSLTHCHC